MEALNRSTEEKPSKKKEYVKEGCSVPVAHRRGYQFRPCLRTKILLCFLDTGHVNGRIRILHLNFESVCFDQILQDHVRKRRIRYQDHMRVGQALCHDLLWNDCCGTIVVPRFIVERLLWNDSLWNDSFRPFSERHFYCV